MPRLIGRGTVTWLAALVLTATACGADTGSQNAGEISDSLRVYTSVTQATVDAVVGGFESGYPGVAVEVFRAPTGELAARIEAERREGGLAADVLWLTDPLSIQQYARDGLLRVWDPANAGTVPAEYRTDTFFGTRLLNMVIVAAEGLEPLPGDWEDLTGVDGEVAIPDPAFAGSAFGLLAFFALSPEFGLDFYGELRDAGGVQVRSPGDVVTGVAEGLYAAGITLDRSARAAIDDGSPIVLVWPASGAVSMYSPIAVVDASTSDASEAFVEHVLSEDAQAAIAATGWQPIRTDVDWTRGGSQRTVDWSQAFNRQEELLDDYRAVFAD